MHCLTDSLERKTRTTIGLTLWQRYARLRLPGWDLLFWPACGQAHPLSSPKLSSSAEACAKRALKNRPIEENNDGAEAQVSHLLQHSGKHRSKNSKKRSRRTRLTLALLCIKQLAQLHLAQPLYSCIYKRSSSHSRTRRTAPEAQHFSSPHLHVPRKMRTRQGRQGFARLHLSLRSPLRDSRNCSTLADSIVKGSTPRF